MLEEFDFNKFEVISDEELAQINGGIWAEFLGGFSALGGGDPYIGTFITPYANPMPGKTFGASTPYGAAGTPNDGYGW